MAYMSCAYKGKYLSDFKLFTKWIRPVSADVLSDIQVQNERQQLQAWFIIFPNKICILFHFVTIRSIWKLSYDLYSASHQESASTLLYWHCYARKGNLAPMLKRKWRYALRVMLLLFMHLKILIKLSGISALLQKFQVL